MKTIELRCAPAMAASSGTRPVCIRPVRPTDAMELERFYSELSAESRRTRFLSFNPGLSTAQSISFCTTDHDHREGFVATIGAGHGARERIVGHLCLEPDDHDVAEVAIAVADDLQHNGIGGRLLAAGVGWARREHIGQLTATMFADNAPIHRLLAGLGLPSRWTQVGAGVAEITIDLSAERVAA